MPFNGIDTVEPVLKDLPFNHPKVVFQDRWSHLAGLLYMNLEQSVTENNGLPKLAGLSLQWSLKTDIYCTCIY